MAAEQPSNYLDRLFPPRSTELRDISPDQIEPSPFQARREFDQETLEELASSIKQYGILTRVRVRKHPIIEGNFQLVFGERRLRAAKMANLIAVPCEIVDYSDEEMKEIGLIENIQRKNLTPFEEAILFRQLNEQDHTRYSIRQIAERIGKNKSYVEDRLTLLRLPSDVLQLLDDHVDVSLRSLQEIAKVPTPEERAPILQRVRAHKMSTQEVRDIARHAIETSKKNADFHGTIEGAVFEQIINKAVRRQQTAFKLLKTAIESYRSEPTLKKKEQLLQQIKAINTQTKELEETLLS